MKHELSICLAGMAVEGIVWLRNNKNHPCNLSFSPGGALLPLAAERHRLPVSTAVSTAMVCGEATRPWPPIYLRLASTIRYARRAVDEHAAGAGLREDLAAKASPNSLSPTLSSIPAASASLTYHRAQYLTSLASRVAFVLLFTLDWLPVSCVGYCRAYYSPGNIDTFWTGLAPTDSTDLHSLSLPRSTHLTNLDYDRTFQTRESAMEQ